MIRILFDAYELAPDTGKSIGIYNYARHLLRALLGLSRSDFVLMVICNGAAVEDFVPTASASELTAIEVHVIQPNSPSRMQRLGWLATGAARMCRKLRADVYFSPKGFLPLGISLLSPGTRTVVTIHDLIPLWYREHYPRHFGLLEEWFVCNALVRSARVADQIITISQASADDITQRTSTRRPLRIIHNGLVDHMVPTSEQRSGDFLFAIGSVLPHKNLSNLLLGYTHYRSIVANPLPLVICGISDPCVEGVEVTGRLSDDELNAYYASARGFVFLSLVEGFGFPPLEAMSHGVAVLCSDIAVLREVTRSAVQYVSPTEPEAIGNGIADLLRTRDPAKAEVDASRRRAVARSYTWAVCAEQFLALSVGRSSM